jgi:hypothetical protein
VKLLLLVRNQRLSLKVLLLRVTPPLLRVKLPLLARNQQVLARTLQMR